MKSPVPCAIAEFLCSYRVDVTNYILMKTNPIGAGTLVLPSRRAGLKVCITAIQFVRAVEAICLEVTDLTKTGNQHFAAKITSLKNVIVNPSTETQWGRSTFDKRIGMADL